MTDSRLLVRNIKSRGTDAPFINGKIKLLVYKWPPSQSLISNAGRTCTSQENSMATALKRSVRKKGRQAEWTWGAGGAESGAWRVTLSLVWSLCTWQGRKLTMKGGSDYCLINTERESPHLLQRIRWGTCQSSGSSMDPARHSVPNGTFTCLIIHLCLFLQPFAGHLFYFFKLWSLLSPFACSRTKFSRATFFSV